MMTDHATTRELLWAIVLAVPFLAFGQAAGLLICPAVASAWWIMVRYFHRRLGGVTGDTLGAMNEVTEILVLAGMGLAASHGL